MVRRLWGTLELWAHWVQGYQSQQERMYHSGPLLHPGYSGAGAVDFEEFLEDHGRQIQQAAQRAQEHAKGTRNPSVGQSDPKHVEYRRRKADVSEIVEAGNGLGHSSGKWLEARWLQLLIRSLYLGSKGCIRDVKMWWTIFTGLLSWSTSKISSFNGGLWTSQFVAIMLSYAWLSCMLIFATLPEN